MDPWLFLAHVNRTTLGEVMRMPHRVARIWLEWHNQQMNRPNRHDFYLMLVAQEVRHVLSSKQRPPLNNMKIKFGSETQQPITREEAARRSKVRWFGLAGLKLPWSKKNA